jgi:uncharacterized protein
VSLNHPLRDAIVSGVRSRLSDVIAVYLFGSQASGLANRSSDVDVALLCKRPLEPRARFELQQDLAERLRASVDVVDLRAASTVMRVSVLRTALVLDEADRFARELFEATALGAYARLNDERSEIIRDVIGRGNVYG